MNPGATAPRGVCHSGPPMRKAGYLAIACCAFPVAVAIADDGRQGYATAIAKVGKQSVQGTLGAHCFPTADGKGDCADATYPLKTTGTIKVRAKDRLKVILGRGASDVRWRLARVASNGQEVIVHGGVARAKTKTYRQWEIKLPNTLRKSPTILGIDVTYPNGWSTCDYGAPGAPAPAT